MAPAAAASAERRTRQSDVHASAWLPGSPHARPRAPRVPSTRRPVPNRRRVTQHRATREAAGEPGDDDAVVEAETSLFESFASLPFAAGASLHRDPRDPSRLTLRVTTSQRDLVANRSRRSVAAMNVDKDRSKGASTPLYHPPFGTEERGVLASSVSPSGNKRMVVRSGKDDGDRGADSWCASRSGRAALASRYSWPRNARRRVRGRDVRGHQLERRGTPRRVRRGGPGAARRRGPPASPSPPSTGAAATRVGGGDLSSEKKKKKKGGGG